MTKCTHCDATVLSGEITGAFNTVEEAACLIWAELCPGMVMGDDDIPHYENAAKAVLALAAAPASWRSGATPAVDGEREELLMLAAHLDRIAAKHLGLTSDINAAKKAAGILRSGAPAVGGEALTIEAVRERMPKYVSARAREFACEAMNDMTDEIHDGGVYALAQWFDAIAAQPASPLPEIWVEAAFVNLCEALGLQAAPLAYLDAVVARAAITSPLRGT